MRRKSPLHIPLAQLREGLEEVRGAPSEAGTIELIVCRPAVGERVKLDEATIDEHEGVLGDNWLARGSTSRPDGSSNPACQVTVMNVRATALVAGSRERWELAGDQIYVDFDLSGENIPPGTHLPIGTAVLEVSEKPHTGCAKFAARFGSDALKLVNSAEGMALNLRGINTAVVTGGFVRDGDKITKIGAAQAASESAAAPIRSRKLSQ